MNKTSLTTVTTKNKTTNYFEKKGNNIMKKEIKRNIPVTLVGADTDPDIIALRNTLEGSESVEVREDGTLAVKDDRAPKSKKGDIPSGVLGSESSEQDGPIDPGEMVSEFMPGTTKPEDKPSGGDKKKGSIPKGVLGTVAFPFRNHKEKSGDGQETMTGDPSSNPDQEPALEGNPVEGVKKGDIPKGVLGSPQDIDNPTESEQTSDELDGTGKKGNIPEGVLGADNNLRDILNDSTTIPEPPEDTGTGPDPEIRKKGDVPGGVLGTPQWYSRPEMQQQLNFEMKSMEAFVGKPEWGKNCGVLDDGRMYWKVRQRIKADRKNGRGCLYDTTYEILLVYEPNHPRGEYGTSVHAYLKAPNDLNLLQRRVNMSRRTPKNIPHVITDANGMKYLCTAGVNDFGTSYNDPRGVATAKTAMLAAIKWLHNFECGLLSQEHWNKFQQHGVL